MATKFGIVLASGSTKDVPVYAGQPLKGKVCLETDEEIQATEMKLVFFGIESVVVEYQKTVAKGTENAYMEANRNIIQAQVPLNQSQLLQDGKVLPGKYELPFVIELPEVLPSVMSYAGSFSKGSCEVYYRMKATLAGFFSCEADVVVLAKPLAADPVPYKAKPVENDVTACCASAGPVIFAVKVDDTRLEKGETTKISLSGRNKSNLKIPTLTGCIKETCFWKVKGYTNSASRELQKISLNSFPGLIQADKSGSTTSIDQDWADILSDIAGNKNVYEITMPVSARPSFKGALINCSHFLELTLNTSGMFATKPVIRVPLQAGEARVAEKATTTVQSEPRQLVTSTSEKTVTSVIPENFSVGAKTTNPVLVPERSLSMGGLPVVSERGDESAKKPMSLSVIIPVVALATRTSSKGSTDDASIASLASSSTSASAKPSVAALLDEMEKSVDDYTIVQRKLEDRAWRNVVRMLTAEEYGKLLEQVESEFDQPRVAFALGECVKSFTSHYVIAALKAVQEWNRVAVLERILPLCKEMNKNRASIKDELTEWEKLVTKAAFEKVANA